MIFSILFTNTHLGFVAGFSCSIHDVRVIYSHLNYCNNLLTGLFVYNLVLLLSFLKEPEWSMVILLHGNHVTPSHSSAQNTPILFHPTQYKNKNITKNNHSSPLSTPLPTPLQALPSLTSLLLFSHLFSCFSYMGNLAAPPSQPLSHIAALAWVFFFTDWNSSLIFHMANTLNCFNGANLDHFI